MLVGLAMPSAALAEAACYDAKVRAAPVHQVPSDVTDCGSDCIVMSWPWFVDLRVKRVIEGALPHKSVRVLAIQHTYRVPRERTWLLRKTIAGGYNVVVSKDGAAPVRCPDGTAAVEPYIRPRDRRTLDDLRDAAIRRHGLHPN